MTNGTQFTNWTVPVAPYTYWELNLTTLQWDPKGGGQSINVGGYALRSWSGIDRSPATGESPSGHAYYTTTYKTVTRGLKTFSVPVTKKVYHGVAPKKKRSRVDIPHPYSIGWQRDHYPASYTIQFVVRNNGVGQLWGQYREASDRQWNNAGPIPDPPWTPNDQIKLVNKLSEQIRGSDFNMAVFMGESAKTLQLIGDSAIKVAKAYHATRKGNVVEAAAILLAGRTQRRHRPKVPDFKSLSQTWLELQYGWMPLLKDMKAGAEQFAHATSGPKTKRYSAQSSTKVDNFDLSLTDKFSFKEQYSTCRRRIIAYISEDMEPLALSGILDPEIVAWELVPFSFVVDWFLPFGNYLEARAAASNLKGTFVTSTLIKKKRAGLLTRTQTIGSQQTFFQSLTGPGGSTEIGSFTRTVDTSLQVPMPNVKSFGQAASMAHCANAMALFGSMMKRK